MARSEWMYVGDNISGITFQSRPGVMGDRFSHPEELVWRYLPLPRFVEALRTRSLFFTRLSYYAMYGDRREGSAPLTVPKIRESVLREQGVDLERYNDETREFWLTMLQTVLVNCWHKREHESEPMWERYGRDQDSVAIVSTLDRLIESMPKEVTVGHVEYVDFETHLFYSTNSRDRAFMKARTLEDEREVRAVLVESPIVEKGRWSITIPPGQENGHPVDIDLRTLIASVVLSPVTTSREDDLVASLQAAGISAPVKRSECSAPPRY
jgi:hypothetical protein